MACNTPTLALEGAKRRFRVLPTVEGDMACNTLPYKIAVLREAHQLAPRGPSFLMASGIIMPIGL
jgi:hypothetical protein